MKERSVWELMGRKCASRSRNLRGRGKSVLSLRYKTEAMVFILMKEPSPGSAWRKKCTGLRITMQTSRVNTCLIMSHV